MSRKNGFREKGVTSGEQVQIVTFQLDDQEYGLLIHDVVQVVRMVAITRAPQAPRVVEGMLNLRGKVIPVIGLRKRFDLPHKPYGLNNHLLIARSEGRTIALLVDVVNAVRVLPVGSIDYGIGGSNYLQAVGRLSDRLLLIIDLKKILTFEEERRLEHLVVELDAILKAENKNRLE